MKLLALTLVSATALLGARAYAEDVALPAATDGAPAGHYIIDRSHASITFKVNHMGFSNYTARFKKFDAQLDFDPAHPEKSSLVVTIDPKSIETDFPNPEKTDFNAELAGEKFLDADKFPEMKFVSTSIELVGGNTAHINGNFMMHGVTKPLMISATYNGGYPGMEMDPHARIGFSAFTTLNRSDYGIGYGVPAPGSRMGVADTVNISLEAEFNGPALPTK